MATYEETAARLRMYMHDIDLPKADDLLRGVEVPGFKAAADGAAADTSTIYFAEALYPMVGRSAALVPHAALTAHDTNYAVIDIAKADGVGGALTVLATIDTRITAGTGNWVTGAKEPFSIAAAPFNSADEIAAGQVLAFRITKVGTGVVVPAFGLRTSWYLK